MRTEAGARIEKALEPDGDGWWKGAGEDIRPLAERMLTAGIPEGEALQLISDVVYSIRNDIVIALDVITEYGD